jgi:hypothetical protein
MSILLAVEFASGRFSKVLVFKSRKDGSGSLPLKWNGTTESMVVRGAARHFAAESAARHIDYEVGGKRYRATKFA